MSVWQQRSSTRQARLATETAYSDRSRVYSLLMTPLTHSGQLSLLPLPDGKLVPTNGQSQGGPSGWEGNRRSGVALAMCLWLGGISNYVFDGFRKADVLWHLYILTKYWRGKLNTGEYRLLEIDNHIVIPIQTEIRLLDTASW